MKVTVILAKPFEVTSNDETFMGQDMCQDIVVIQREQSGNVLNVAVTRAQKHAALLDNNLAPPEAYLLLAVFDGFIEPILYGKYV